METIERAGFFERYKFKISRLERLNVGEIFKDEHDKAFKVVQRDGDSLVFEVDGEQVTVDLAPHWERGSNAPIKLNRDGVMNLIGGVFSQAEKDLESFYADGGAKIEFEPLVGESREDARKRRKSMYEHAIKECEDLLGEVYTKYTKVKAYYTRLGMTPIEIAEKMGTTPEYVTSVIYRLGLDKAKEEDEDESESTE